ncbi:hypothetical protein C8J57DRAFT_1504765 [Mycena rebaudengoi]|nr:hypothetical protein C8J57DRAFT_1504765 [Mycena rebaudengoi]
MTALALVKNPNTSTVILGVTLPEQPLPNLEGLKVLPKISDEILARSRRSWTTNPLNSQPTKGPRWTSMAGSRRVFLAYLLEGRMMPEFVLLLNGQVLITNGARTGYAAIAAVDDPVGGSNADNPVLTPSLYTPDAPLGHRISNQGMPTTQIPRMYHSTATLMPFGNILLAGSNPNPFVNFTVKFPT